MPTSLTKVALEINQQTVPTEAGWVVPARLMAMLANAAVDYHRRDADAVAVEAAAGDLADLWAESGALTDIQIGSEFRRLMKKDREAREQSATKGTSNDA